MQAIARGEVGIILMAGGQGTRLGSSQPKGMYDIGLPSGSSLFRMQGERIRKLGELASKQSGEDGGKRLVWYVMTSGPTRVETERYFKEEGYFGLREEDVIFFDQGVLPALSPDGKIFLSSPSSISLSPDGNGGLYSALRQPLPHLPQNRSILQDMSSRGIKHIHAYCVDNCLVKVADPVFLGYCISKGGEAGAKVVRKLDPRESVGVLALRGGKFGVVEYSELSEREAEMRDEEGELTFRAANIANHYFSLEFLEKMEEIEKKMAFHIARKKITHVDPTTNSSEIIKPSTPNGMKLELFIFDCFPHAPTLSILEVPRSQEFSPLKNAPHTGSDDPQTSRRDILAEHKRWLEEAGVEVGEGVEVEIAPGVSYAGEGLEGWRGRRVGRSGVLGRVEDFEGLEG